MQIFGTVVNYVYVMCTQGRSSIDQSACMLCSILICNSVHSLKEVSKYNHVHNCRILQSFPKNTITNRNVIMLTDAYIAGDNYNDLAIWLAINSFHLQILCLFRSWLPIMVSITLKIVKN